MDLVAYVSSLLPGALPDLSAELKKREFAPIVAAVSPKLPALLALEHETDVEGAFALLWDAVLTLPDAETQAQTLLKTVESSDAGAVLKLRVAASLFNKAQTANVQFNALVTVFAIAQQSGTVELLAPYLEQLDTLLSADKLSVPQRQQLLQLVADVTEDPIKELLVLEKLLSTYQAEAKQDTPVAERAVKLVLQNPVDAFLARVDLATSVVVADALAGSKLLELLQLVSTQTLKEFVAFQASAGDVFATNEIKPEELADTMRLFTLCTLPTGFTQISYADVAAALDVPETDVEQWVVRAITAGLVSAKIDQLARTVVISRALQRGFNAEQWKEIDAKLQLYKKNVGGLLDIIRSARRAQEQQ